MLISYSVQESVDAACFPPCQEEAKRKPPQRRMTRNRKQQEILRVA
jgi:hypothetical protein